MTKFEAGKVYRTRDGREARVYATDGGGHFPIHGAVKCVDGWAQVQWRADGGALITEPGQADDLMLPTRKVTRFLWVYRHPEQPNQFLKLVESFQWRPGSEYEVQVAAHRVEWEEPC